MHVHIDHINVYDLYFIFFFMFIEYCENTMTIKSLTYMYSIFETPISKMDYYLVFSYLFSYHVYHRFNNMWIYTIIIFFLFIIMIFIMFWCFMSWIFV